MKITRRFTKADENVLDQGVEWTRRTSRITNTDGSVVFEMTDAEVPKGWSQLATDIMVSKYFRKAGVPQFRPDGQPELDDDGEPVTGPERSAGQVIRRLAGCWRHWGEQFGYFDDRKSEVRAGQWGGLEPPLEIGQMTHLAAGLVKSCSGFGLGVCVGPRRLLPGGGDRAHQYAHHTQRKRRDNVAAGRPDQAGGLMSSR